MPTIFEREDSTIVLNAALDRLGRKERIVESVEEAFAEIKPRLLTISYLEFLAKTRTVTPWIKEAYRVANSNRLGHYHVSRKHHPKKEIGVLTYTKATHEVQLNYSWEEVAGTLEELRRATVILGEPELAQQALNGEGICKERFIPSRYCLSSAYLTLIKPKTATLAGIPRFSYSQRTKQKIYPQPNIHKE